MVMKTYTKEELKSAVHIYCKQAERSNISEIVIDRNKAIIIDFKQISNL